MELVDLRKRLEVRSALDLEHGAGALAAVAAILRPRVGSAEVLLIRRAEREGDPWSGHMAFPGGRRDPSDESLLHTARRETVEEVGLDLSRVGELIGRLDDVPTHTTGLIVRPFVFALRDEGATLRVNHEVADATWVALGPLRAGVHDCRFDYVHEGRTHEFPAFDVAGRAVWGLTYRMLQLLLRA